MKKNIPISLLLYIFVLGCTPGSNEKYDSFSSTRQKYKPDSLELLLASPIIYDVLVKNPDLEDTWTSEKIESFQKDDFVNIVFEAIYNGKVKAYNYHTGDKMTLKEIRTLENSEEFDRSKIGKIQFEEDWYFNEKEFILTKKIKSIILAYEVIDQFGEIRAYKGAFLIPLNEVPESSTQTK